LKRFGVRAGERTISLSMCGATWHLTSMLARRDLGSLLGVALVGSAWPTPAHAAPPLTAHRLFRIERSKNANVVCFDALVQAGGLDPSRPIDAFWLMLAENGHREELTWTERRLAYGFSVSDVTRDRCRLRLSAFKQREVTIERYRERFRATLPIAGQPAVLERIFVKTSEAGLLPHVEYLELSGLAVSGARVRERITAS
jgi:hypothetical protein